MKKFLIVFIITIVATISNASSCKDPSSCLPTLEDNNRCISYVMKATGKGSNSNDYSDIVRSCVNNFAESCVSFVKSILKRRDLSSVTDYAKACEANYSNSCIKALYEASYTKSKNTLLDFTRACKQNINAGCVNNRIREGGHIDYYSLKSYARSCQIYNKNLNGHRQRN